MKQYHVHLVDDDHITVHVMRLMMLRSGFAHTVETFGDGRAALEALDICHSAGTLPDLLVVDLNMPVMDGWALLDALATRPWAGVLPPVIILTSSIDDSDRSRAGELSIVRDFVCKPLTSAKIERVRAVVGG